LSELSVVILCGQAPRHLYVANRLCRAATPLAVVHESGARPSVRGLRRYLHPRRAWRKASRWLWERAHRHAASEAAFFFEDAPPRLARPELVRRVPHINDAGVTRLVDELEPDVVAVFGTSLIRPPLLGRGRLGMINLHGGLSPHYRGADGFFWALYNGEPQHAACTLHYINAGIDTGDLIAHVCPAVHEDDDDVRLFWRGVKDAAEVYAEVLQRLARGERLGQPQTEKGRLYQVHERTLGCQRELHRRLSQGLLQGVDLPARVRWFKADSAGPAAERDDPVATSARRADSVAQG